MARCVGSRMLGAWAAACLVRGQPHVWCVGSRMSGALDEVERGGLGGEVAATCMPAAQPARCVLVLGAGQMALSQASLCSAESAMSPLPARAWGGWHAQVALMFGATCAWPRWCGRDVCCSAS